MPELLFGHFRECDCCALRIAVSELVGEAQGRRRREARPKRLCGGSHPWHLFNGRSHPPRPHPQRNAKFHCCAPHKIFGRVKCVPTTWGNSRLPIAVCPLGDDIRRIAAVHSCDRAMSANDPLRTLANGLRSLNGTQIFCSEKMVLLIVSAILLLVALTWKRLIFAFAVGSSESRPALLHDAQWGKPDPAFSQRFRNGTSEAQLLQWLAANSFDISGRTQSASRTVHSLPCNERVAVSWKAKNGTIQESNAVVSDGGCL